MMQAQSKPVPVADMETKPFWDYCKKHELRVQKCLKCGKLYYPPSSICPHCLGTESEWAKLSGKGQVYSFIIVQRRYHPAFAALIPYTVAIIETEEGIHLLSNVIECKPDAVKIGMPVQVVFDDITPEATLPKFKPA
jgi:uncharacterized OB-fold protein